MQYLIKQQLIDVTENIFAETASVCNGIDEDSFFNRSNDKWSVAENLKHLIISTKATTLAFTLPAFIVRLVAGKPNRNSSSYEALVEEYIQKLAEERRASGRFVPQSITKDYGKDKLMMQWQKTCKQFIAALKNKTTESKLDDYFVKHPLLGRITLRELCYFTMYHTQHHLKIIQQKQDQDQQPKTI